MKKLILRDNRLSFVDTGAAVWHLKSAGGTPDNEKVNISNRTIGACDIALPSGQLVTVREMSESEICGHCLRTARRYNTERYPEVWIQEVENAEM